MAYTEKSNIASYKYKSEHIKRVPLDMQTSDFEKLKAAAESIGEPVNRFIKTAIAERLEKLGK